MARQIWTGLHQIFTDKIQQGFHTLMGIHKPPP